MTLLIEAYPDSNKTREVHDPAQAWNALTVGAFTNKTRITDHTGIGSRRLLSRWSFAVQFNLRALAKSESGP